MLRYTNSCRVISIALLLGLLPLFSLGQETITPLLLDKAVLSGVGLKQVTLDNTPERAFFQKNLYRGPELGIYVVSSETWSSDFRDFWFDEFLFVLNGKARLKPEGAEEQYFHSGDYFFAPKGYNGEWETDGGAHYYYELSLITTKRADSTKVSPTLLPKLLNKEKLSGLDLDMAGKDKSREILAQGIELTISLVAEKPQTTDLSSPAPDKLICLLAGMLSLTDQAGDTHTFTAGDFLVLPHGFMGKWSSQGHGIVKYLEVMQTE